VVEGFSRFFYRMIRAQAYRCDACRYRFFSIRKFKRMQVSRDYLTPAETVQPEAADDQPIVKAP
jgi:hypothetical protein